MPALQAWSGGTPGLRRLMAIDGLESNFGVHVGGEAARASTGRWRSGFALQDRWARLLVAYNLKTLTLKTCAHEGAR